MPVINTVISCIFDFMMTIFYLHHTMHPKRNMPHLYALIIMCSSICINIPGILSIASAIRSTGLIDVMLETITLLITSCLFQNSLHNKILLTIIYVSLCRSTRDSFRLIKNHTILTTERNDTILQLHPFCSNLLVFIALILFLYLWNKKFRMYIYPHLITMLLIPVSSFMAALVMMKTPLSCHFQTNDIIFIRCIFFALNVSNFATLSSLLQLESNRNRIHTLESEILFQQEKYNQISKSYKRIRRIIHDTRKHYFSIQQYVNAKEYGKLCSYLKLHLSNLDVSYAKYNSGNLVIDSFLNYYDKLFQSNNIKFTAILDIKDHSIPVNDYDLTIILGNLLDNAWTELSHSLNENRYISIEIYENNNSQLIIHTKNPVNSQHLPHFSKKTLAHGYGLENIENTVRENQGIIDISRNHFFDVCIILPISNSEHK